MKTGARRVRRLIGLLAIMVLLLAGCTSRPGADDWPTNGSPTLATRRWTRLPISPLSARHDAVAAWVGDRFLVIGGRTERPCPDTGSCAGPFQPAERDGASFDPRTGGWRSIALAPTPVYGENVVVVGDALYVLVGKTERDSAALLRYRPADDRWDTLRLPRNWSDPVAVGDRIVWPGDGPTAATTGRTWTDLGRIYDPRTDSFAKLPPPLDTDGLDRASGLVVGSRIVAGNPAIDRHSGRGNLLDPVAHTWTALPSLPGTDRFAQSTAADENEIFVWGGGTTDGDNLSDGYLLRL